MKARGAGGIQRVPTIVSQRVAKAVVGAGLAIALGGCSIALDPIERWSSTKDTKKEQPAPTPASQPAQEPPADAE